MAVLAFKTQQVAEKEDDARRTYVDVLRLSWVNPSLFAAAPMVFMLSLLDYPALRPRDCVWSDPTLVLVKRLTDPSTHTNLLRLVPLPNKAVTFMQSAKDNETSRNTLTNFEQHVALWRIARYFFGASPPATPATFPRSPPRQGASYWIPRYETATS